MEAIKYSKDGQLTLREAYKHANDAGIKAYPP
jgi:hypothetical protein